MVAAADESSSQSAYSLYRTIDGTACHQLWWQFHQWHRRRRPILGMTLYRHSPQAYRTYSRAAQLVVSHRPAYSMDTPVFTRTCQSSNMYTFILTVSWGSGTDRTLSHAIIVLRHRCTAIAACHQFGTCICYWWVRSIAEHLYHHHRCMNISAAFLQNN